MCSTVMHLVALVCVQYVCIYMYFFKKNWLFRVFPLENCLLE